MIKSLPQLRQQFLADGQSLYEFDSNDPRYTPRLSLEQMKKQAKDLLKALKAGREWRRAALYPQGDKLDAQSIKLADAQLIIAREQGLASWARLKHYIESSTLARQALSATEPQALDAEYKTLHIRCGSDIMYPLAIAGFNGDFLQFADPYIEGPVPQSASLDDFLQLRANYLAAHDAPLLARDPEAFVRELKSSYLALEQAREYERVCFWFEHDAYDVLVFLKLLHFFSDTSKRAPRMRFICADHYPGVRRFNGLGQLPAEAMRLLWQEFEDVHESHYQLGKALWQAYTSPTPEDYCKLLPAAGKHFPQISAALHRHLQQLPDEWDGLNLTEKLTLQILHDKGEVSAPELFYKWYTTEYEPLVFMGDSSYWNVLRKLAGSEAPAIHLRKDSAKPRDWRLSIAQSGLQLLEGKLHWADDHDFDDWFGGVHNAGRHEIWYLSAGKKAVVKR